jgi:hypothetical protein
VISGTPRGTAPRLSGSIFLWIFSDDNRSLIEITNRRIPPAIIKSATVIPRSFRINLPIAKKTRATKEAVNIDCNTIRRTFDESSSMVNDINIGKTPIASTATNRGTKHSQKAFIILPEKE